MNFVQNFIYFYNGGPFSNGAIEVLPDHDKIWEKIGIHSSIFKYEVLKECFSKVFNHSIQINSFRILGIPIPPLRSKTFILIDFSMDSKEFEQIRSLEIEKKLNAVLNRITKIKKYYYYASVVYMNRELIYFMEQIINKRLMKKKLSIGPKFRMDGKVFSLEINSYIHKNYRRIFEKAITSFFDRKFPGFIKNRLIHLMQHNYHFLIKGNLDETVIKSFLSHIFRRIESYHSIIISSLSAFNSRLIEKKDIIRSYPFHTLKNIEQYLDDLNRNLNSSYWLFPNPEYGKVLFKLEHEQHDPNFQLNKLFDQNLLHFAEQNIESFQPFRDSLKETLAFFIQSVNSSIIQKQNGIKTFRENELSERMHSIENESVFCKEILMPILKDLGYDNVQETHGQHEYGIDILFSNYNKFKIMEWNGIVAKTGNINLDEGTEMSRNLKNISKQVYQAKKMDHLEKNYRNVKITRVFIVTNGKINYHAKQALFREDPLIEGNLFFLDYDDFMNLF